MRWFLKALNNYVGFSGRAQRAEYWFFVLFMLLSLFGVSTLNALCRPYVGGLFEGVLAVVWLALLLPSLAVTTRRLHDTGRSGWCQLVWFLPFIGHLLMLVWLAEDSDRGTNAYGPNPKLLAPGGAADWAEGNWHQDPTRST